jgi:hypothetical protein
MKKVLVVLLLLSTFAYGGRGRSSGSRSSGSRSTHTTKTRAPKAAKPAKTVHVKGHTRKDGTYVSPYDRRSPGTAIPTAYQPYRKNHIADGYAFHSSVERTSSGKIKRSKAAKGAFEHQQPCPSTGKTSGRCPGYIVDHVKPLECGGADAPSNMQWQTTQAAKLKDKTEHACHL